MNERLVGCKEMGAPKHGMNWEISGLLVYPMLTLSLVLQCDTGELFAE